MINYAYNLYSFSRINCFRRKRGVGDKQGEKKRRVNRSAQNVPADIQQQKKIGSVV
jgi:hypothetical protein